jgi:hypothetical protein
VRIPRAVHPCTPGGEPEREELKFLVQYNKLKINRITEVTKKNLKINISKQQINFLGRLK